MTQRLKFRSSTPVAVDLYAGVGGLTEGFLDAGFDVRLAVDNNSYATETQRANHASRGVEVVTADLVARSTFKLIQQKVERFERPLDVVIGGPPCQGFSKSNMRTRNRKNPNNRHIYTFAKYVQMLEPPIFVMENVAGMEVFEDGRFPDKVKRLFARIGYHVDAVQLNAADFGVPQRRNRLFFVGNRLRIVNWFPPAEVPKDEWTTVWEAIGDLPSLPNGCGGGVLPYKSGRPSKYAKRLRKNAPGLVNNNTVTNSSDLIIERYKHIPEGRNWSSIPDRLMKNYKDKSRCHQWIYHRLSAGEPSIVITNFRKSMLVHPYEHRGLSVREAARLQSFPDNFVFKGPLEHQQQQVANAVPPFLARAVAETILNKMIRAPLPLSRVVEFAPELATASASFLPMRRLDRALKSYFRSRLANWARKHLRTLPWRQQNDPFQVLVAETLLQKTTAAQVLPVFEEIIVRYPNAQALSRADLGWLQAKIRPIGIRSRAKRLKAAARSLVKEFGGHVPKERRDLSSLDGVGPYIASAVACFAFAQRVPLVDSNILRIFERFFGLQSSAKRPRDDPEVWRFAAKLVPENNPRLYNTALVDFGALVCTHKNPDCPHCPLRKRCRYPAKTLNRG